MHNRLSFGKGVLFSSKCGYVGRTYESNLMSANDPASEKHLSPGELRGEFIRQISMPLYDSLETTFSQRGIKKALLYSPYGGKYRHLFLYSKRKRIRKKNHWNAVVEMLSGGNYETR